MLGPALSQKPGSVLRSLHGWMDVLDFFKNTAKSRNAQLSTHNPTLIFENLFFVSVGVIYAQSESKNQTVRKTEAGGALPARPPGSDCVWPWLGHLLP